jgi:hypothetical protein
LGVWAQINYLLRIKDLLKFFGNVECDSLNRVTVIAHYQPTTIVHLGTAALNLPALTVALPNAKQATVLGMLAFAPLKGRNGRLNPALSQLTAQFSTVKAFVRYQFLRVGFEKSG